MKDHFLLYNKLNEYFGDLHWWPAETNDEILIGSILTQNTSWKNVEKAILELKKDNLLSLPGIAEADVDAISLRIRSAGFFRQKASRIKSIATRIVDQYGRIDAMQSLTTQDLVGFFGGLKGIGQETLDSILLYVFNRPVMIVDTYTRRIISRINYPEEAVDEKIMENALSDLRHSISVLKNYHACLVELGKRFCRKSPDCTECPLNSVCNYAIVLSSP
ncbi:MAG: hypothetical protein M1327_01420 [Candidatus Thermoplasmatota archaeon]|nr:hypothetical protein [Candidatus Thermoplasmatota archaeon]